MRMDDVQDAADDLGALVKRLAALEAELAAQRGLIAGQARWMLQALGAATRLIDLEAD